MFDVVLKLRSFISSTSSRSEYSSEETGLGDIMQEKRLLMMRRTVLVLHFLHIPLPQQPRRAL